MVITFYKKNFSEKEVHFRNERWKPHYKSQFLWYISEGSQTMEESNRKDAIKQ